MVCRTAHRGRDVADAELRLDVRVVELADEGVRPRLAGVDGDVHVVLPVPLPPLLPVWKQWIAGMPQGSLLKCSITSICQNTMEKLQADGLG